MKNSWGCIGVYARFINKYQERTEPLRRLKKKDQEFIWEDDQQNAFTDLKQQLMELLTLRQPDFSIPFELHTDAASKHGIAVILCQRIDGAPYPISFASSSMNDHEKRYSVQEMEALSIFWGINKFRKYLECGHFTVYTDHSSLQWFMNTKEERQDRLFKWKLKLQGYDFSVIYTPGKTNHAADKLSRDPLLEVKTANSISSINWADKQAEDEDLYHIIKNFQDVRYSERYKVFNNILYRLQRGVRNHELNQLHLVIPKSMQELHTTEFAGHFGSQKKLARCKQQKVWWANMDSYIKVNIGKCTICQRTKTGRSLRYLEKPTTSEIPFTRVALDFLGPLPISSNGNKYILVCQDMFTRYVKLYPIPNITQDTFVII